MFRMQFFLKKCNFCVSVSIRFILIAMHSIDEGDHLLNKYSFFRN